MLRLDKLNNLMEISLKRPLLANLIWVVIIMKITKVIAQMERMDLCSILIRIPTKNTTLFLLQRKPKKGKEILNNSQIL